MHLLVQAALLCVTGAAAPAALDVVSSLDGTPQPCLLYAASAPGPRPLLVFLHPWSHGHDSWDHDAWRAQAQRRGWHLLVPHFRSPNNTPEACASKRARQDVLDATAYVCGRYPVDVRRVFLAGTSGGAHMAMAMAAYAPERWAAVSAWCGISDLAAWHAECRAAGRKYARDIERCVGGAPGDSEAVDAALRERSPIHHLARAKDLPLDLAAGIHDGHTGSVPIHHTLDAFNAVAKARGAEPVSAQAIATLSAAQPLPSGPPQDPSFGVPIHLRRHAGPARVTIFEGGHEALPAAACAWFDAASAKIAAQSPGFGAHYLECVRRCVDNLLEHGTDRYGPRHLPLLMSIVDPRTKASPREPEVLDGLIRSEGRLHRRNPGGADLWEDQPLLRVLFRLTEVTGAPRYAEAARAYIRAYLIHARKPNGLLAWGSHIYYDAYKDAPGGDGDGAGPHEILVLCPEWTRMWDVDPEGVRREIEGLWEWHVVDKHTGLHNRHDDKRPGCDFAFSGGSFLNAFAFLCAKTGDAKYLDWAKIVAGRHWNARNPETNLAPDAPGTGDRYDAHHCFTTLSGPHAAALLRASEVSGDPWFAQCALAYVKAWSKYAWDEEASRFWGMLTLDGAPVKSQAKGPGYDVWKPTGHIDIWRAIMFSYEFPLIAAQAAVYAYEATGDPAALECAQRWAANIRADMPPGPGRRWAKELAEALPNAKQRGGTYAENYGRAASFFLHLHYITGADEDLAAARALAGEAIDKLYHDGWFVGHPAKPYYENTDGVGLLLYALLELAAYPERLAGNF